MQDHVGPAQCLVDGERVGDVADHEFCIVGKVGGTLAVASVNLRREIIEKPDFVAGGEKGIGGVRADESRAPGDQYSRHSSLRVAV